MVVEEVADRSSTRRRGRGNSLCNVVVDVAAAAAAFTTSPLLVRLPDSEKRPPE